MYSACITEVKEDSKENLLKSLEFINWKNHVKKDSTVFIKPNFTFPYYKEGITTTPELLKNLLEIIKDRADNIIVGESDGGNNSFTADVAFKGHGMHEICKEAGVELVNLSKRPSTFIEDKIQGKRVKVQLPNLLLEEFHIKKTFMDRISILPFKSDFVAKTVFDSLLTPLIYKMVNMLKKHKVS